MEHHLGPRDRAIGGLVVVAIIIAAQAVGYLL
jgi:hypothetical protein